MCWKRANEMLRYWWSGIPSISWSSMALWWRRIVHLCAMETGTEQDMDEILVSRSVTEWCVVIVSVRLHTSVVINDTILSVMLSVWNTLSFSYQHSTVQSLSRKHQSVERKHQIQCPGEIGRQTEAFQQKNTAYFRRLDLRRTWLHGLLPWLGFLGRRAFRFRASNGARLPELSEVSSATKIWHLKEGRSSEVGLDADAVGKVLVTSAQGIGCHPNFDASVQNCVLVWNDVEKDRHPNENELLACKQTGPALNMERARDASDAPLNIPSVECTNVITIPLVTQLRSSNNEREGYERTWRCRRCSKRHQTIKSLFNLSHCENCQAIWAVWIHGSHHHCDILNVLTWTFCREGCDNCADQDGQDIDQWTTINFTG